MELFYLLLLRKRLQQYLLLCLSVADNWRVVVVSSQMNMEI